MNSFSPFARGLKVDLTCPHCSRPISYMTSRVPHPNWDGDSSYTSERNMDDSFECPYCQCSFDVYMKNTIIGGEIWIYKMPEREEIECFTLREYEPTSRNMNVINDNFACDQNYEYLAFEYLKRVNGYEIIHPYIEQLDNGRIVEYDGMLLEGEKVIIYECKFLKTEEDKNRLINIYSRLGLTIQRFKRENTSNRKAKLLIVVPNNELKEKFSSFCKSNDNLKENVELLSLDEIRKEKTNNEILSVDIGGGYLLQIVPKDSTIDKRETKSDEVAAERTVKA